METQPQELNISCYINGYDMKSSWPKQNILRYPRLDTVLMVEEFIRDHWRVQETTPVGALAKKDDVSDILCDF